MTPRLDGSLEDWNAIRDGFGPTALLCGNGLSINVWQRFEYRSLFEHASDVGPVTNSAEKVAARFA